MKIIKTKSGLVDFKGELLKEGNKLVTQGTVLSNVMAAYDVNPTQCWQLGKKFATDETVDLKAEDVVFIKEAINKASTGEQRWLTSVVAGQLLEILDASEKNV